MPDEAADIKKNLIGLKLIDVVSRNDELLLTFEGERTLIITGGYCREVFYEIKRN